MPRRLRSAAGGFAYHVLNRAVGRGALFDKSSDYAAFEKVLRQAQDWQPMRAELEALRRALQRGSPFGDAAWQKRTAKELGLTSALQPRGRPRKAAPVQK
jgi:hypothetical protein